jgi:hypothetical protein
MNLFIGPYLLRDLSARQAITYRKVTIKRVVLPEFSSFLGVQKRRRLMSRRLTKRIERGEEPIRSTVEAECCEEQYAAGTWIRAAEAKALQPTERLKQI